MLDGPVESALQRAPLATAEFVVVDVETNGLAGEAQELTEVGLVLVGGGELHDRFSSLVGVRRPLSRGVQRLTGITQAMVDDAPPAASVLPEVRAWLAGRVLVAHNASFDRGALQRAFAAAGLTWTAPPVLCTVALARRFAPLATRRGLVPLAGSLGVDVEAAHRALPDAETCARIFCALFGRLAAHAPTVGEAVALLAPRRRAGRSTGGGARARRTRGAARLVDAGSSGIGFDSLPSGPGVYLFRDDAGRVLYVGKSRRVRARARAHFAPSAEQADWTAQAAFVDARPAGSELGALVLENRLIKELRPPGNVALKHPGGDAYLRCRLDIAYPILEVASEPAAGRAVNVGPLRGQRAAAELVEQLNALFGLRRCGRSLPRRAHASAYGQMGRCLSPCLGDLDPNAYRARLDEALAVFAGPGDAGPALLGLLEERMGAAAAARRYERAAVLRRRRDRLEVLLDRLGGAVRRVQAAPRLVAAGAGDAGEAQPGAEPDWLWVVAGRVAHWGAPGPDGAIPAAVDAALAAASREASDPAAVLAPDAVDEVRIVAGWLAGHPDVPALALEPRPAARRVAAFAARAVAAAA